MKTAFYPLIFGLLLVCIVGCGGNCTVTGTVKFPDGTPLDRGSVIFESDKLVANGKIQKNGTYSLISGEKKGILPGTYRVSIGGLTQPTIIPPTGRGGKPEMIPSVSPIDAKFHAPGSSGLTCEVKGRTKFDIMVEPPQ